MWIDSKRMEKIHITKVGAVTCWDCQGSYVLLFFNLFSEIYSFQCQLAISIATCVHK